ncbi:hypothetical protein [Parapedobacter sp.]
MYSFRDIGNRPDGASHYAIGAIRSGLEREYGVFGNDLAIVYNWQQ